MILFFILSSVSLVYADYKSFGVKFQIHELILFLVIVSVYNVYKLKIKQFDFNRLESNLFVFFDIILIYGLVQLLFFNLLGINLSFGMDNWRYAIISYRQDQILPFVGNFDNAPWMRPSSIFAEPVFLGLFCTWLFVFSFIAYFKGNKSFSNIFRLLSSFLLLVFVASRASLLGVGIVLLLYFIYTNKDKIRIVKILIGIIIFLILLNYVTELNILKGWTQARFSEYGTLNDPRIIFLISQIEEFIQTPIFGSGRGMTAILSDKILPLHFQIDEPTGGMSFWITLLYESGVVGFAGFMIFIISLFKLVKKTNNPNFKSHSELYYFSFLAILFNGIFLGPIMGGMFWMAILLFYLSLKIVNTNSIYPTLIK